MGSLTLYRETSVPEKYIILILMIQMVYVFRAKIKVIYFKDEVINHNLLVSILSYCKF